MGTMSQVVQRSVASIGSLGDMQSLLRKVKRLAEKIACSQVGVWPLGYVPSLCLKRAWVTDSEEGSMLSQH